MMSQEQFENLAARVLANEATPDEQRQLDAALAADARLRGEFQELRALWQTMQQWAPAAEALHRPAPPLPGYRTAELQSAVAPLRRARDAKAETPSLWNRWFSLLTLQPATLAAAACLAFVMLALVITQLRSARNAPGEVIAHLVVEQGEVSVARGNQTLPAVATFALEAGDQLRVASGARASLIGPRGRLPLTAAQTNRAETLLARLDSQSPPPTAETQRANAPLFGSRSGVLAMHLLSLTRAVVGIAIYSPRDNTVSLTPVLWWKAEPGKRYSVSITNLSAPDKAPLRLTNVTPPVRFAEVEAWRGRRLQSDSLHRLIVEEAGNPLSRTEVTFRTLAQAGPPAATDPAEKLLRAWQHANQSPRCTGDALAELLELPPGLAASELALRLKLTLFGSLGLQAEYDETAARLRAPTDVR